MCYTHTVNSSAPPFISSITPSRWRVCSKPQQCGGEPLLNKAAVEELVRDAKRLADVSGVARCCVPGLFAETSLVEAS